jgi:hypothetical protein
MTDKMVRVIQIMQTCSFTMAGTHYSSAKKQNISVSKYSTFGAEQAVKSADPRR